MSSRYFLSTIGTVRSVARIGNFMHRMARTWLAIAILLTASLPVLGAYDAHVEQAQRILTELGFEPGSIDGLIGGRTRRAVKAFQNDVGMPASGRLTRATRKALRDALNVHRTPEQAPEAPQSEQSDPAPKAEPEVVVSPEPTPKAEPEVVALPEPAPKASGIGHFLSYAELGWNPPQSGARAKAQFLREGGSPEMRNANGEVVIPRGKSVFVLNRGEQIPGFDCDPSAGSLTIEFMLGLNGPMLLRSRGDTGFCQLGFGAVFGVGRTLRMHEAHWGEQSFPAGKVKLTKKGLRYLNQ